MTTNSVYRYTLICLSTFLLLITVDKIFAQSNTSSYQSENIFSAQEKHVHSSSIVELPNGDLLTCWFEGSGERKNNDVVIMGSRKQKGKSIWSKPFVMADTPNNPDCNPVLFLDNRNRLHLTWIVVVANRWESSLLKTRISSNYLNDGPPNWDWQDIILLKPGDSFAEDLKKGFEEMESPELAWAEYAPSYEKMIIEAANSQVKREVGWMGRLKPLILGDGKILMPLYSDGYNVSMIAISENDGESWYPSRPIVGYGNIQPALLQKKDKSIVAYMRDNGSAPKRVVYSISNDNGQSWSIGEKTDIYNPGSSIEAISLKDGQWLMINNDIEEGRHRLAVTISDDEGLTWKWKRYLEYEPKGKGNFSYPSAIQTKDGRVHVTYSHHTTEGKTIKHVSFMPEWVKETSYGETSAERLGYSKGRRVILLHMDDLGMCNEANEAGKYYIENDFILSGAVMMPCDFANQFVEWVKNMPKADIGVHLTHTSEWNRWRWSPVAKKNDVPGLFDSEGKFWKSSYETVINSSAKEIEIETRAQIENMLKLNYLPSHIDTHMGTLYGTAKFFKVFLNIAEEYKLPANAIDLSNPKVAEYYKSIGYPITDEYIDLLEKYNLPKLDNFGSVPSGDSYDEVKTKLFSYLNSLGPGITEIVFHPSVETENMKSITGSWQQRAWEAEIFSDPEVIKFLKDNDIIVTTWREIMERFNRK